MYGPLYFALLFAFAGAAGMAIANRRAEKMIRRQRWLKYFVYVLITVIILTSLYLHFFLLIAILIVAACCIELITNNTTAYPRMQAQVIISFFIFLIIAAGFILYAYHFIDRFLLFVYFQVFIFDGFCQITGQLWGKHPLVPSISPAKTVEGFIGGWLFCILSAVLIAGVVNVSWTVAALFGLLTGFASFCGDLLASFYKRKLRVKDYSNWLPGQGGFLDRFDSLLFTGLIYYTSGILIFKDKFSEFINVVM